MPTAAEILRSSTEIANTAMAVAVAWHVVLAVTVLALAFGWRPAPRRARVLIAVPLISVAALAFAFGNPFNGAIFTIGAAALCAIGTRAREREVARASTPAVVLGVLAIALGWLYPHFVSGAPALYLIAAPVGLLPCPTLAVVIGFALLGGGFGSPAWSLVLAGLGLMYGLIGVAGLGVYLDVPLVGFATALAIVGLTDRARIARRTGGLAPCA